MPARLDESLQQHPVVAEGLGGLASRTGERLGEVRRGAHDAHALPAAARRGLDEQRETHALRFAQQLRRRLLFAIVARQHRDPRRRHQAPCLALRSHPEDRRLRRPDEDHPGLGAGACKGCVLGQEPVARMDAPCTARACGGDDRRDVEIALARRRRSDRDGLVGEPHVQRVAIGLRVDGDRAHAETPRRAYHAAGDFTSIGDQHAVEHGHAHIRKMPYRDSPGSGRTVDAASASATTARVSVGSMTPSSQSRALA